MLDKRTFNLLFGSDRTNILTGAKGSGKTNFACVLMESLVSLGYQIYTNIHFFDYDDIGKACNKGLLKKGEYRKKPDDVHVVTGVYELALGLVSPGKKVVILDEAGIIASSSASTSKETRTIKYLAYICRHFKASLLLITQISGSVPPDLREKLVDYHIKVTKKNRYVEFCKRNVAEDEYGKEYINFIKVEGFNHTPHSMFSYDSNFSSGFDADMDLKKLLVELSKLGSSLDIDVYGPDIIRKFHGDKIAPPIGETKKEKIIDVFTKNPDINYKEIANRCDTTPQSVGNVLSKYKKEINIGDDK